MNYTVLLSLWHWLSLILVSDIGLWKPQLLIETADQTDWDVTRLADRVKNSRKFDGDVSIEDASLAKYFNNPELGDLELPATILDRFGRIIVWYLPSIFSLHRVVCTSAVLIWLTKCHSLTIVQTDLNGGTKALRPRLDSMMQLCGKSDKSSWRNSAFCPPPDGGEFGAGVLNMSPGWFQQLQDVSLLYLFLSHLLCLLICSPKAAGQKALCLLRYQDQWGCGIFANNSWPWHYLQCHHCPHCASAVWFWLVCNSTHQKWNTPAPHPPERGSLDFRMVRLFGYCKQNNCCTPWHWCCTHALWPFSQWRDTQVVYVGCLWARAEVGLPSQHCCCCCWSSLEAWCQDLGWWRANLSGTIHEGCCPWSAGATKAWLGLS